MGACYLLLLMRLLTYYRYYDKPDVLTMHVSKSPRNVYLRTVTCVSISQHVSAKQSPKGRKPYSYIGLLFI